MTNCTLCAELRAQTGAAPWNRPLIETTNFVVIPSLGALIEGWVLVVPKEHHISMGALPEQLRAEADELELRTRTLLSDRYGSPIVAFEHGPSASQHGTGCGVDHAHLHLLPLACDLSRYVTPFVPHSLKWHPCNWVERTEAHKSGLDYLYLKPDGARGLIAVSEDFGSQVFRRAIADYLGAADQFSWREFPQFEIVGQTIEILTKVLLVRMGGRTEHAA
jgi:ATP adenylyltransferase